jgi:hypothetical protein
MSEVHRNLETNLRTDGSGNREVSITWLAPVAELTIVILSLLLTVVRHEAMHVTGAWAMGGQWLGSSLVPGSGLAASVDLLLPPDPSWVPLVVVVGLPYLVDVVLMLSATAIAVFLAARPRWAQILFQHALYFSALDIVLNSGASIFGNNDWTALLAAVPAARLPIIGAVIIGTVTVVLWQSKRWAEARSLPAGISDAERFSPANEGCVWRNAGGYRT